MIKNGKEKRRKLRVDFKTHIVLRLSDSEIHVEGSSKDLSLKGIFVYTQEDILVGSDCNVRVVLTGMEEPVTLDIDGDVVRKELKGIAIDFKSMDVDSYTHLKNVVRYNATAAHNPDDIY